MIKTLTLSLLFLIGLAPAGWSAGKADVMLQIEILQGDGASGQKLDLTEADLLAMHHATLVTSTPWTEGVQSFEGVSLHTLLDSLKVTSGTMYMYAVNDYRIEVPISDAQPDGPIIAYLNNGAPMPLREKGPLWLVYPYDADADYRSETIYARSIWQLNKIEITP